MLIRSQLFYTTLIGILTLRYTVTPQGGIGAIWSPQIDGVERVVMYASRSLTDIEKRYQTYEQECLAVVWATELFRKYIRNRKTTVLTDCIALQWLKTRTEVARVSSGVMRLQEFHLEIRHRKGKKNANADSLTRSPAQGDEPYGEGQIEKLYETMQHNFSTSKQAMVLPIQLEPQRERTSKLKDYIESI